MSNPATLTPLIHRRERVYHSIMLVVSLAIYAGLAAFVVSQPAVAAPFLVYVVGIPLAIMFMHGMMLGRLRANAIRVSPRQFPALHAQAVAHSATLGLATVPDIFLLEAGGMMNAFATRFFGRDFVVIHSDVLAMAEAQGADAVSFIVAHELAHIRRGHLKHRWLIGPGRMVPYLGAAYSRACEYTCDRFGAHCEREGAIRGLVALAAGPHLYRQVDVREYAKQAVTEKGFWVKRSELMSTHPHLSKRVAALLDAGIPAPGVSAPATSPIGELSTDRPASFAS